MKRLTLTVLACLLTGCTTLNTIRVPGISGLSPATANWSGIYSLHGDNGFIGTGVRIGPDTILTAKHVITGETVLHLIDGSSVLVISEDPDDERAVLWGENLTGRIYAVAAPRLGEPVMAVGNIGQFVTPVATQGHVSGFVVTGEVRYDGGIQPGMSGGPLLNAKNEVVGVCSHSVQWGGEYDRSVNPTMGYYANPVFLTE